jgi:hypothetical protein
MNLNESIVEDAALEWFGELGYAVGHGPHLAPGEPAAERESFGEVVLVGRLCEAIRRLNVSIPEEASACAWPACAPSRAGKHADRRAAVAKSATV